MIFAMDPGPMESAYILTDNDLKPIAFGKTQNKILLDRLQVNLNGICHYAIEKVENFGMPAGADLFDTCIWIGRFIQRIYDINPSLKVTLIKRHEVKIHICNNTRAKDANIRQELINRYGNKGTKKSPGYFYNFKTDIWQAYAIAVTYHDKYIKQV